MIYFYSFFKYSYIHTLSFHLFLLLSKYIYIITLINTNIYFKLLISSSYSIIQSLLSIPISISITSTSISISKPPNPIFNHIFSLTKSFNQSINLYLKEKPHHPFISYIIIPAVPAKFDFLRRIISSVHVHIIFISFLLLNVK